MRELSLSIKLETCSFYYLEHPFEVGCEPARKDETPKKVDFVQLKSVSFTLVPDED